MASDILQGLPSETVSASGGDLDGANATVFTFSEIQARTIIGSHPNYLGLLFVKINAAAVSASDWDFVIQPGGPLILDLPRVSKIAILGTAAATYGTDFNVKGMK